MTRGTGETGVPILPVFLVLLVFPVFLLGRPAPAVDEKMQRSERILGAQENHLRSLLFVNEKVVYLSTTKHARREMCE